MYYAKIAEQYCGFTNQIFNLIVSIIIALSLKENIVIIDNFLDDINKTTYTPISDILNIKKLNIFLKQNYNLIIIDKNNIQFEIISAKYGTNNTNYIDLTNIITQKFYKNNSLVIDKTVCFNDLKGDPCPGIVKSFILQYKMNEYIIEEKYNETLRTDIKIDFDGQYKFTHGWITSYNNNMFEHILKNITYNNKFLVKSESIINGINKEKKINCIHLRLEDDGIKHWSKQNNITCDEYAAYLTQKYINLIIKYISKTDENIILSSSLSNGVIDFLEQHNYNYRFVDKFFDGREKNAIIDLLVSSCCNNIFIGNFNITNLNGSSFSYYIWKLMKDDVLKIFIDLDKIYDDEVLHQ